MKFALEWRQGMRKRNNGTADQGRRKVEKVFWQISSHVFYGRSRWRIGSIHKKADHKA